MASTLDVIVANEPGKTISVPYKDDEPIFFLIQRLSHKNGDHLKDNVIRSISINGVHIDDFQQSIEKYRIFGNTITYKPQVNEPITVFVKCPTGSTYRLQCHSLMTLDELKEMIQDELGAHLEMRIIYGGRQLIANLTLEEYKITNEATLHMTPTLRGGGLGPPPASGIEFADVSKNNVLKIEFSSSAPKGRIACWGTNIECKCECTKYDVLCGKGYGLIELSESKFCCPNCCRSDRIVPITVGFNRCKYRFHGIKTTGEQYSSDWKTVSAEDAYQHFDPSQKATWRRLIIESAKINDCDDCAICLESMKSDVKKQVCGHRFHSVCYSQWNSTCPSCHYNRHLIVGGSSRYN
ncbi:hypothetical protein BGZ76_004222 [Entomortierella beljakovae]|nr:hypothetical protein BGZ76_004222 [Entomortierella beljakovae]